MTFGFVKETKSQRYDVTKLLTWSKSNIKVRNKSPKRNLPRKMKKHTLVPYGFAEFESADASLKF